mmetsp:Transcript_12186/g.37164  ORF Transcript_12186/g.37164 Transcript_12186/m.37164 type:complete len:98 (+) Transcript_12186:124-417(+)
MGDSNDTVIERAQIRTRYLKGLRALQGQSARLTLYNDIEADNVTLEAFAADRDQDVLVSSLPTSLGVLPSAALRWSDIKCIAVKIPEQEKQTPHAGD